MQKIDFTDKPKDPVEDLARKLGLEDKGVSKRREQSSKPFKMKCINSKSRHYKQKDNLPQEQVTQINYKENKNGVGSSGQGIS